MKFSEQQNAQYKSFQNGESIYVDPDSVAIEVAGNDRAKFLHNFCTADINSLSSGDSTEAFVLDAKGKTLAFLLVICNDDRLILLAQQSQAESLLQHLNKYAFLQEATLTRLDEAKIVWRIGNLNAGIPTTLASGLQVQVVESTTAESEEDQSLLSNSVEKAVFEAFRVDSQSDNRESFRIPIVLFVSYTKHRIRPRGKRQLLQFRNWKKGKKSSDHNSSY